MARRINLKTNWCHIAPSQQPATEPQSSRYLPGFKSRCISRRAAAGILHVFQRVMHKDAIIAPSSHANAVFKTLTPVEIYIAPMNGSPSSNLKPGSKAKQVIAAAGANVEMGRQNSDAARNSRSNQYPKFLCN